MKKKLKLAGLGRSSAYKQFLLVMRLTVFLTVLTVSVVVANTGLSQEANKLSVQLKNATLLDVLNMIENNSSYYFMFNNELINLSKRLDIDVQDKSIKEILTLLSEKTGINYKIYDRQIVLSPGNLGLNDFSVQKQSLTVSGRVTDSSGNALPGVTVIIKETTKGTITDIDGNYSIENVPGDAVLVFSFIGMKPQEISVKGKTSINVMLAEDAIGIEEVVAVGYGTQKKGNLTGAVSSVQTKDLTVAPVASTSNTLAGRLPGLISVQSNGQPGNDAADLSIRGFGDALVIVDGIESSFNAIDPNQIESISILKDGSASIYGARAGNGVILVTTKRGVIGKPVITFNVMKTMQGITTMPDLVSAGQYAEMLSESWIQSGQKPDQKPYTDEQIEKYYEGTDPLFPNTNWRKELIRDWAPQQQYNGSVRGGSESIKYYGFFGYLDQGSMWKHNGGEYKRYNFQSNVDAQILDNLSMSLTLSSIIEDGNFPARDQKPGQLALWQDYWYMLPIYPAHLPDPTKIPFGGNGGTGGVHITSNSELSGYNNYDNQNLNGTFVLNYDFKAIKGLSAKAFGNYVRYYNESKNFIKPVDYYTYDPVGDIYTLAGSYGSKAQLSFDQWKGRTLTGQLSLSYDRTFSENHHITFLAVYEVIDIKNDWLQARRVDYLTPTIQQLYAGSPNGMSNDGNASEAGRKSYVSRLNYSYRDKYLIETIFRADASAKFPSDKRWGYFPSVSLGWRMNKEPFMQSLQNLDNLKLRLSFGESGNDNVGNFQYLQGYHFDPTILFGATPQQSITATNLANPNLTWEKTKIYNVGFDLSLWKRLLYCEADVFYRSLTGIPETRLTSLPSTFGATLPEENLNSLNDRGFELMIGSTQKIGDFAYDISGNISWSRAKWDHFEEPEYEDPDQERLNKKSGKWTDWKVGYVAQRLFSSQEEIYSLMFDQDLQGNKTLRPGDVMYTDLNKDGIIDWKDQTEIGKGTTPHWILGMNANLTYKNFDFSALFQGAFGYYKHLVFSNSMTETYFEERWTEENNNVHALVPRLGGSSLNWLNSDYFYKKAGYLRLKTAALGYNFPKRWLQTIKMQKLRIYLAGTNLLTFDKLKKYKLDPEAPSGVGSNFYPQQKTITLGATISF